MQNLARRKGTFFAVVIVILLISYVAAMGVNIGDIHLKGAQEMRFGIDIRGGVDVSFVPKDLGHTPTEVELEAARTVVELRLDQKNILDRDVTIDKENGSIIVRFPWQAGETDFDPAKAIEELGAMAELTFIDGSSVTDENPTGTVIMTGSVISKATAVTDNSAGKVGSYMVQLDLTPEGQATFADATGRLVGSYIGICLDGIPVSTPGVNERIDSDVCYITGTFTREQATLLANQINSGALPFAMVTENYRTISPDLGSNALNVMLLAGLIAFLLICLFLIFYYRASGIVSVVSLLFQVAGQIILLTWPGFTITLPGIAGIILSIGMGVDANIIAAERIREEMRDGKSVPAAISSGFKMSFSSVFDGNVTVLIVAFIMMFFGSGAILSFAYTLLFGIIMNFLAGVTATKLMTSSLGQFNFMKKPTFFMSKKYMAKKEIKVFPFFEKRKIYFAVSGILMVFGIIMTFVNGVTLDIQFKGGTILTYDMVETTAFSPDAAADLATKELPDRIVTAQLTTDFTTDSKRLVLNTTGKDPITNEEIDKITEALVATYPEMEFEIVDTNNVSPFYGKKFFQSGLIAIFLSLFLIILYVWFSFRKIHGLSAGVMAMVSLFHDLLIVFFTFIVFRIPIGDSFVAVALTILGYSINDTIVIYDRIRENTRKSSKNEPVEQIVNKSISQSFTRSLITNLAVFVSVLIVAIFAIVSGLESIRQFALPMAVGAISGCYSTVCIAGPLWTMWQKRKKKAK